MTIDEFISVSEPLKKLVRKYDQQYHVFNNKTKRPSDQARLLLVNIIQRSSWLKDTPVSSLPFRRIVLLGQTGVGKTAAVNTIMDRTEMLWTPPMRMRSTPVTATFSHIHCTNSDRCASIFDPPGFFHTQIKHEELETIIARTVFKSSPHAFLIVFPVNMRFTDQDQQILQIIEMMFGEEVLKYSIILFTHGDQLEGKSVEELIEENSRLRDLVDQCGGRYHIFNNKDVNNREQVNDLLQKIDTMIEQNGGGHYSHQMFEDL